MIATTTQRNRLADYELNREPLGFEAGDVNLQRYVGNSPSNKVDPTGLYEEDVHYYVTLYLALAAGIPKKDALEIAWATQATDVHPLTEPLQLPGAYKPAAVEIRRRFHFRTPDETTVAGSKHAASIVNDAIAAKKKDNMLMGIGMHAFEDSWAHATFGPKNGHGLASLLGRNPDDPSRDVKKAMNMTKAVYDKLVEYRKKHFPGSKSVKTFEQIKKTIEKLMVQKGKEKERSDRWQQQVKDDFKADTKFDPGMVAKKDSDEYKKLLKAANQVEVPKK